MKKFNNNHEIKTSALEADEYKQKKEKKEILNDIEISLIQIDSDLGVNHSKAKRTLLQKLQK